MSDPSSTLLTWHAQRAGFEVLVTALDRLSAIEVDIEQVWLLVQRENRATVEHAIREAALGLPVELIAIDLSDPTRHRDIITTLRQALRSPLARLTGSLHINVSPGTPAMHAVWLFMHAAGELPTDTRLWSTQKRGRDGPVTLAPVDFDIPRTYLARIRAEVRATPERPTYRLDSPSPARREALDRLARCARIPRASILVLGERGVGKTRVIERFVPALKARSTLVTIACGALDPALAESRLFGYARGAHSTATRTGDGLLHAAQGGIAFFDEVQDLARPVQRKLVRLLEERRFARIGEAREVEADIELVFGSNRSLDELRECLDPDLLDRLAMLIVVIPPLRECREAIEEDWRTVWQDVNRDASVDADAPWNDELASTLRASALDGNFRDLQRLAYEMLLATDGHIIGRAISHALDRWARASAARGKHQSDTGPFGPGTVSDRTARFQRHLAAWAIERHGTQRAAAAALNCSERSLRNWLRANEPMPKADS